MIWTNLLLNISLFCIYLALAFLKSDVHPAFGASLAGVLLMAIFPALLSFYANRNLLTRNPMVLKVVLSNALQYLVYIGVFALGVSLVENYFLLPSIEPLDWSASRLPFFWILVSWLTGTYFGLQTDKLLATDGYNITVVETSIIIMLPSVLLLTFKEFPLSIPLALIALWFVALVFSLALEGRGRVAESVFRYDIIILHILVSLLAATALFVVAFFGQIQELLVVAQQGFVAFVYFVFGLLNSLFSEPAAVAPPPFDVPTFVPEPQMEENMQKMPIWFYAPFIILAAFLAVGVVWSLIKLLGTRLDSKQVSFGRRPSIISSLLRALQWLVLLIFNLLKKPLLLFGVLGRWLGRQRQRLRDVIRRWLPPKTAYEKIFRAYDSFLRWGGKLGYPREATETPLEYVGRLQAHLGEEKNNSGEAGQLTEIFIRVHYGPALPTQQQAQESEALLKKIRG